MAALRARAAERADATHRRAHGGSVGNDPEGQARVAAFLQGLQELGWSVGRNVIVDSRWSTGYADARKYAAELVSLAPDVILANTGAVAPLLQVTSTVPIVFALLADPVGAGYVDSLARPGGTSLVLPSSSIR